MERNPWENEPGADYLQGIPVSQPRKSNTVWDIHYRRILSVWPWMIPAGLLFFAAAWLYLRYQDDVYRVGASIVMQDQATAVNMYSSRDPINDNIARLKSPTLMKRVVDTMGLQFKALVKGNIKDRYLYDEISWRIVNADPGTSGYLSFDVTVTNTGFDWKSGNQTGSGKWDSPFFIQGKQVLLQKKMERVSSNFTCFETDAWGEAFALTGAINVTSSKISNVVEIGMIDIQRQRAVDVINTLIQIYNYSLLTERRKSQEQAIKFINERLAPLAHQLDSSETALAEFKVAKGLILQGEYLGRVFGWEERLKGYEFRNRLLINAEQFIRNPATPTEQLAAPGVETGLISRLVDQLVNLWEERKKLALTVTENNPKLRFLDEQIATLRNNLDVQLKNEKKVNELTEEYAQERKNEDAQKFSLTPFEEKRLNEILRFRDIKLKQFLDLLNKKEDAGIALASMAVETFVVRPALLPRSPIGPARMQIMISAFLIGIWLPFIIALVAEFLNNKIISKNQLQQMLTPPILAELDLVDKSEQVLHVKRRDRSVFGEQIRSLRAALRYYSKEGQPFYVLITSSMSGEGKSFISANLAASFALQGKRVALLEFDLRRPKLSKRFGYNEQKGISTILINKNKPDECTYRIHEDGHLDLFPAGPVPPNPSELMSGTEINAFKAYLDAHYDVIVIDTPPNGIVADAQLLNPWASITLVLTRFRLTVREQVREIEEWHEKGLFQPMGVLLNGVSVYGYYGNKYGYYYAKRKYGYKYYSEEKAEEKEG
jgi:capsular exopolysaccharide synthesis family protein